jgi:Tol biopolymer transport system component
MIGRTLSHYEITAKLGAGAMGEVWRATDTKLGRDVALKVLPDELATDPERLERFEREAKAIAALNHPNIVTIHSVEEADGVNLLTMELVEGKSLDEMLPAGGFDLDQLFPLAIQIADALAVAHEKGTVHRDLKPGNVMVTEDGRVKVLDFGLAKLAEKEEGAEETQLMTREGMILGTVPYMSPEQVQAKPVDHRSDIFSLGILLYEMATGRRPFRGDNDASVISAVLKDRPPSVTEVRTELPNHLGRIIQHCLEKDPERRYQSAKDVRNELDGLRDEVKSGQSMVRQAHPSEESPSVAEVPSESVPSRPDSVTLTIGRKRLWPVAGVAAVAAVALGWWLLPARNSQRTAEPLEITPFTNDGGWKEWPQLSPDGEKVAYVWYREGVQSGDLYVKALGLGTRPLPLTESPTLEISPVWSPDGREIAFARAGERGSAIYLVPALGGQERKLVDLVGPSQISSGYTLPALTWSPDGRWLAFSEISREDEPAHIVRLSLDSLERTRLTSPPEDTLGDFFPAFSPDGEHLAFLRSSAADWGDLDVWVQPLEGGQARRLTFGKYDSAVAVSWTPGSDEIVYSTGIWGGGSIHRVSLEGGEPRGIPGIGENTAFFTVRGSRIVYQQRHARAPSIWRVPGRSAPAADRVPRAFADSMWIDYNPAFSPDGQKVAFQSYRSGQANIWLCDRDGSSPVQLTRFTSHTGTPRWSPDGRRIVFDSLESGNWDLWVVDAEGGVPRQLTMDPAEDGTPFWSRDGRWIYFHSSRSGRSEIWKQAVDGGETVQVTDKGGFYAEESWDGESLYYTRKHSGGGIWRKPLVGAGADQEVLAGPVPTWGDWAVAKTGIYFNTIERENAYSTTYRINFFDFASGEVTEILRLDGAFEHLFLAVSPDEEWLLFGQSPMGVAELMLAENFR